MVNSLPFRGDRGVYLYLCHSLEHSSRSYQACDRCWFHVSYTFWNIIVSWKLSEGNYPFFFFSSELPWKLNLLVKGSSEPASKPTNDNSPTSQNPEVEKQGKPGNNKKSSGESASNPCVQFKNHPGAGGDRWVWNWYCDFICWLCICLILDIFNW